MIQTYKTAPDNFKPLVEVAGCYCFHNDKLLMLQRHPSKSQGGLWGIPCGKLEAGETPLQAVKREVKEEVGIVLDHPKYLSKLYFILQDLPYVYHIFESQVDGAVILEESESMAYQWVSIEEAYRLPLIAGGADALDHFLACRAS